MAALAACDAGQLLHRTLDAHPLPVSPDQFIDVIAAGKAAQPMLAALLAHCGADSVRGVLAAEGAHPLPDARSIESGSRALRLAEDARRRDDLLVLLLSGGASAMLAAPAEGVTLDDKVAVSALLLTGGLPIAAMNAVRKHLSSIKGGQLGAAAGASITYAISDVHAPVEDDPSVIGSGPAVADRSTFEDAIAALRTAALWDRVPAAVRRRLERGARGEYPETVKPGDARLERAGFVLAGSRWDAMAAVAAKARALRYDLVVVAEPIIGEARDAAVALVDRAVSARDAHAGRPVCIVASGETTVTLRGGEPHGVGGRNQELALAAAPRLAGAEGVLLSVGTDGIDGPTDAAGAIVDGTTLARALAAGLDPACALASHASYEFFRALGDLVITGPTGTNVGDLQIVLFGTEPEVRVRGR